MLRTILTVIGVVELVRPAALIDRAEALALENPADCELRPWVRPAARVEGLLFLLLMWWNQRSYETFKRFLGIIGIIAVLSPRTYVDVGADLAYTDGSACEWKPWVYPMTRLVGLLYVLVALGTIRGD